MRLLLAVCLLAGCFLDGGYDWDGDGVGDFEDCFPDDPDAWLCPESDDGPDMDEDGFGFSTDCDDHDPEIYPGAVERPNCRDDDCDGEIDQGLELDADQDGFSVCDHDCNDQDPQIYPGRDELPGDGIDQDCDGED